MRSARNVEIAELTLDITKCARLTLGSLPQSTHAGMGSVLLDSFEGFDGERQCFSSVSTGDRRRQPVPRSLDERNNLRPQRFDVDHIQVLNVNARPNAACSRWSQTAN